MSAPIPMRVGFAQFAPVLGDANATRGKIKRLAPQWSDADLVVLPELCNSGYNFADRQAAWAASEVVDESSFVDLLTKLCVRHDQYVVTGFCEREGDRLFNTALLIGPDGVRARYRKLHLFQNEKDIFAPGNLGLPVCTIGDVAVGMLICFDWLFPEAWRVLALQGADVICHPSNLVLPGHCQRAIPTYALINKLYVVTANRIGKEGDLEFTGGSLLAGPRADVLAKAGPDTEEVHVIDIDMALARDKFVTARNHVLADRRPEEYRLLVDSPTEKHL